MIKVAIVGPCASGKSTLQSVLVAAGYDAHHPAQEHSYVPTMWQRRTNPDFLIYLDINAEAIVARRPHQPYLVNLLPKQHKRLAHARQHCDLYIDTSELAPIQVQEMALQFLNSAET